MASYGKAVTGTAVMARSANGEKKKKKRFRLQPVAGREDTMVLSPSAAQCNVQRPQVGAVQIQHLLSIRTNHDGDYLP